MTGLRPQVLLDLPAGLAAVRLDAAGEPLDVQARRLVEGLQTSDHPVPDVEQTVRGVIGILDLLGALNVALTGKFAVATPEGPATATVVVAMHPLQVEDPEAAAADLAGLATAVREIVQRRAPYSETRVVALPAGPAVVGVVLGEFRLPPERTGSDAEVVIPSYRVQILIPLPTGEHLLALDVSTTSAYGWPTIARHAVAAAGSVRFDGAG
ncbi:MAG: hypothetical protein M3408_00720 [Actinomycetota bacterium]|jgi:hypothetical protein|nr:hypothetical protein [Actinomycetota bacterium]